VTESRGDSSLERLRRWSAVPPSLTGDEAARRVRGRLPVPRRRVWLRAVAAVLLLGLATAGFLLLRKLPQQVPPTLQEVPPMLSAAVPLTSSAVQSRLMVVPLRSGTVLYITTPNQGDEHAKDAE
jgi:hypothetical protein